MNHHSKQYQSKHQVRLTQTLVTAVAPSGLQGFSVAPRQRRLAAAQVPMGAPRHVCLGRGQGAQRLRGAGQRRQKRGALASGEGGGRALGTAPGVFVFGTRGKNGSCWGGGGGWKETFSVNKWREIYRVMDWLGPRRTTWVHFPRSPNAALWRVQLLPSKQGIPLLYRDSPWVDQLAGSQWGPETEDWNEN